MLENKKLLKEGRWVLFMLGLPQSLATTPWQVMNQEWERLVKPY